MLGGLVTLGIAIVVCVLALLAMDDFYKKQQ